MTQRFRQDLD